MEIKDKDFDEEFYSMIPPLNSGTATITTTGSSTSSENVITINSGSRGSIDPINEVISKSASKVFQETRPTDEFGTIGSKQRGPARPYQALNPDGLVGSYEQYVKQAAEKAGLKYKRASDHGKEIHEEIKRFYAPPLTEQPIESPVSPTSEQVVEVEIPEPAVTTRPESSNGRVERRDPSFTGRRFNDSQLEELGMPRSLKGLTKYTNLINEYRKMIYNGIQAGSGDVKDRALVNALEFTRYCNHEFEIVLKNINTEPFKDLPVNEEEEVIINVEELSRTLAAILLGVTPENEESLCEEQEVKANELKEIIVSHKRKTNA